jgi:hypothetical protein
MSNDTQFDNFDETPPQDESESSNRTFLIAAGILGGIVLLSVACLAAYALIILPQQRAATQNVAAGLTATKDAENAVINIALTATASAAILPTTTPTATITSTPPVNLATVTNTPGSDPSAAAATGTTPTGAGTSAAATSTVAAALTQAAAAQLTIIPTSTGLANTGFADDFGVPGLVVMGLAFVIVILLARKLRTSPVSAR